MYAGVFWCRRAFVKTLFSEEEPPTTIRLPPPPHPWVYLCAIWNDGKEENVTEVVEAAVTPNEVLTPARLLEMSGLTEDSLTGEDTHTRRVDHWEYMDSQTFEVRKITPDGLVNAVKPKVD